MRLTQKIIDDLQIALMHTKKDGTVIKIKKGMKVTNEEAIRDLNRRITKEFVPIICS